MAELLFIELFSLHTATQRRIAFRVLGYYAIHEKDLPFLAWLLENGLDMESFACRVKGYVGRIVLPSLLAIAIKQNIGQLLNFLFMRRVKVLDLPPFLSVNNGSPRRHRFKEFIGAMAANGCGKKRHSIPLLQKAVHDRDYELIRSLAPLVDADSIVTGNNGHEGDGQSSALLSPLGEAIILRDNQAAALLLGHGATANALVCHRRARETTHGSHLNRASPLLAAIDMRDLSMIQLLLKHGAAVDYPPRQGLTQTPLQRAAEIGNFDVAQLLLSHGAPADSAPFYSGGTPLQFAAVGGFVDIATLLLGYGADPSHAPAEGEGRTAFEAAAEWGRFNMLTLLAQWHVDLDLVIEPGLTQYQRALRLATQHGQMASKRYIERIHALRVSTPDYAGP